jgi:hypothetical protein
VTIEKITEIHAEIDRLSSERTTLWHQLSQGHDAQTSAEVKRLDARLVELWEEHRAIKARLRFGERERIIARARQEERLERAA